MANTTKTKTDTSAKKSNKNRKKGKKKRKHPILHGVLITIKWIFLTCLGVGIVGGFCALGVVAGAISQAPSVDTIDISPTGYVTYIYDSTGEETTQLVSSGANRIYVTLDEIPEDLQNAFIAIEDKRFYEHNGIDINGILRAAVQGVLNGFNFSQGASTITQQLLKNNVFTDWTDESGLGQRLRRKIQEQYLALELEKITDKETILENYLNTINLGSNTLGVQAASQKYFGKDVSELTLSEAAVIAGITQNPTKYNPITYPENNAERRETVLSEMLDQGYITQAEYDEAMADDVYSRIQDLNTDTEETVYSSFVDALIEQVLEDLMEVKGYSYSQAQKLLYSGGLSIYTTQDPVIQAICDEEFADEDNYPDDTEYSFSMTLTIQHEDGTYSYYDEQSMLSWLKANVSSSSYLVYDSKDDAWDAIYAYEEALLEDGDTVPENGISVTFTLQPQASVVVMDQSTGEVKAIVGERGEKEASLTLNRATDTYRQPGSTFKILAAYSAALESGEFTLATVMTDEETYYSNGTALKNASGSYKGDVTIRQAIVSSINTIAVQTIQAISPETAYEMLLDYGFTSLSETDIVESLALGGVTTGVSNLELTAAYAAIANGGTYTEPILYTVIYDHDGEVLLENTPETHEVISEETAFLLTSAMEDVVSSGTGSRASISETAVAGKTGTTSDTVDSWFVGFSVYYTCGVWGGYDTNMTLTEKYYVQYLWSSIMSRIHSELELEYADFTVPSGITTAKICKDSGLLAGSMCTSTVTEYFTSSLLPTKTCSAHVQYTICTETGLIATEYCPETEEKTYISGSSSEPTETCTTHTEEWAAEQAAAEEEAQQEADTGGDDTGDGSTDADTGGTADGGTE